METSMSFKAPAPTTTRISSNFQSLNFRPKFTFFKPTPSRNFMAHQNNPLTIRAQKSELNDGPVTVSSPDIPEGEVLKVKEWEIGMFQDEVAASQGIRIRRRPPTGPPTHYVGPFEFRIQSEGNTPRNILEEIVWNKDVEVSQMKAKMPLVSLSKALDKAPPVRDFIGALKEANSRTGLPGLIAEVKKASPSRGVLREDFDPKTWKP